MNEIEHFYQMALDNVLQPHARILIVVDRVTMFDFIRPALHMWDKRDGTYSSAQGRYTHSNGSVAMFQAKGHGGQWIHRLAGLQLTHVFIFGTVNDYERGFLLSRLRSTEYTGKFVYQDAYEHREYYGSTNSSVRRYVPGRPR